MDESPSSKRRKRQRFQPFVIKKGIVMRAKQRQKMALELSKSKNDSTMYNDPKLSQLKFNNRSLSKALSEQKMDNKCLMDEKIQLQNDVFANHEVILALRSELKTLEDDLLQIHEVFRSSLQLLVTLTGHLNVGLQRCTAGRRRSKSVSLGTAGHPTRGSRGLSLAGTHAAQNDGSPRQNGAGRKLHKVLPTVAGNVISNPSIVLPRLPAGGGWLLPPPAGSHRGAAQQQSMEEEDGEEDDETEDEPEPLAESGGRGPISAPMADLSVILEQSVLDGDSLRSSPGRRQRSTGRRSGSLPLAQVVVPAEERLYGDEAWMRQRTPGRERVVVAAEERLFGDEAWLRQRCRGPARVLVPADERLSGDEAWRRSDGSSFESPSVAARRSESRPSQGRGSGGAVAADADRRVSVAPAPPPAPAAGSSGLQTPTGRGGSPAGPVVALCNGDVSMSAAVSPAAATTSPAAPQQLEESVVIQRRTQKPRANGRTSTAVTAEAGETLPGHPPATENVAMAPANPDESVITSWRQDSPTPDESISNSPLAAADPDESIIVSRKPAGASRAAAARKTAPPAADESTVTSRGAAPPAASDPPPSVPASPADQEADQSVIISRKIRRPPRVSVAPAEAPAEEADQSVVIARKVRRPGSVAAAAPAIVDIETGPAKDSASVLDEVSEVSPEKAPSGHDPDWVPEAEPSEARAPPVKKTSKRKSKAVRAKQLTTYRASPGPSDPAAAGAAISRGEATPSPELVVKERYRHMLARRSPRAAADSRVAPASADDPLEGPSNRVWLAAPVPTGRRSRGRPSKARQRLSLAVPPAEDGRQQQQQDSKKQDSKKEQAKQQGAKKQNAEQEVSKQQDSKKLDSKRSERKKDCKLSSPALVVVDRAAVSPAADSSEPEPVQQPAAKASRRRSAGGAAGDGDAGRADGDGDAGAGDGGDSDAHQLSPPAAKRGRGRPRGPSIRGGARGGKGHDKAREGGRGRRAVSVEPVPPVPTPDWSGSPTTERESDSSRGGGGRGRGGRGRGRARAGGRGRRSVSVETLPPVPVPDWSASPAPGRAADGKDSDLFVYPELPAAPTEPEERVKRRLFAAGPAGTESPVKAGERQNGGTAPPERTTPVKGARKRAADAMSPSSKARGAAEDKAQHKDPPDGVEADSVSSAVSAEPVLRPAEPGSSERPVLAEPTSTTETPPAAESSTDDSPDSCSPSVGVTESSSQVPPDDAQPSESPEPTPAAAAEPSPSVAGPSAGEGAPAGPDRSEAVPGPAGCGRSSPDPLPWSVMRPPTPDSPAQAQSARSSPQSSPGSEELAERGGGRRRRKPVSYAEPSLTKKLRR